MQPLWWVYLLPPPFYGFNFLFLSYMIIFPKSISCLESWLRFSCLVALISSAESLHVPSVLEGLCPHPLLNLWVSSGCHLLCSNSLPEVQGHFRDRKWNCFTRIPPPQAVKWWLEDDLYTLFLSDFRWDTNLLIFTGKCLFSESLRGESLEISLKIHWIQTAKANEHLKLIL